MFVMFRCFLVGIYEIIVIKVMYFFDHRLLLKIITFILELDTKKGESMKKKSPTITPEFLIGQRLKAEAKKRHYTNQMMADLIGYAWDKQITPIYNGTRTLKEDQAVKIAKAFGLRVEYVKGIDDWETDEDMMKYAKQEDSKSFKACKAYLETIGLEFSPQLSTFLPLGIVMNQWDFINDYLTGECIDSIQTDFNELWKNPAFREKYASREIVVFLRKPFDDIGLDNSAFENIGKKNGLRNASDSYMPAVLNCRSKLKTALFYDIGYRISRNGEYLSYRSVSDLQKFMSYLDNFTDCAINTFLFDKYPIDITPPNQWPC